MNMVVCGLGIIYGYIYNIKYVLEKLYLLYICMNILLFV